MEERRGSARFLLFMKNLLVLLAVVMISSSLRADEQSVTLPEVVSKGLNALRYSGSASAVDVWLTGSPIEKDAAGRSKILGVLSAVEGAYGKCIGHEVIQIFPITSSTLRIYGVILFEKGPLYARWDCYKVPGGWVIPEFVVNTTAEKALPVELLFRR